MNRVTIAATVRVLAVAILVLLVPAFRAAHAQDTRIIGTWSLNVDKSNYSPGPSPRSNNVTYAATKDGGIALTAKGVAADGTPTHVSFSGRLDGKDCQVSGSPDYDGVALTRIDPSTIEAIRKRGGQVAQTVRYVVSRDGKMLMISVRGTDAKGRQVSNVAVFDKKKTK